MSRRLGIAVVLALASCWGGYATRVAVHAQVLVLTADKLVSLLEAGRPPAAEQMGEYVYPARRARELLHHYAGYSERRSYGKLEDLVGRYEALVRRIDALRAAEADWRGEVDSLRAEVEGLRRLRGEIERALDSGA